MRRRYNMPFGAELTQNGQVRFRLWAPGARHVELSLEVNAGQEALLSMRAQPEGWHELIVATPIGSRYRFRIDGGDLRLPDPASRVQADDVHGPSLVIDPTSFDWQDEGWRGRPWHEVVFYEIHVGAFTPEGTFRALNDRLDHLVALGVTALELMPIADFPGARNWGYDGVLPFAPDRRYGTPEELKELIQAAHAKNLMVFLDVVYNHFGPEGNYLHHYAPTFFTERHHTPWGAAINYDSAGGRIVRDFVINNALYWLEEYHLDGLRLDAVHAIIDESHPDILTELAEAVRRGPGRQRHVHLVLENDNNAAHYLRRDMNGRPMLYDAQWNDDIHHALHVLLTGERVGYYRDYLDFPLRHLGRCLTEGFAYQGESSAYRDGVRRGEPSTDLPLTAFVNFLQNHDQIGNRAFGERLHQLAPAEAVRAATAILLLAPSPPLLFMGEEWAADQPFPFFCDFGPELAKQVTEGRRKEFARFPAFSDVEARSRIPDPNDVCTFESAVLDWSALAKPEHQDWYVLHRQLLGLRASEITPRLIGIAGAPAYFHLLGDSGLQVQWLLGDGTRLHLLANLGPHPLRDIEQPEGLPLYVLTGQHPAQPSAAAMPGWSVAWFIEPADVEARLR